VLLDSFIVVGGALAILMLAEIVIRQTLRLAAHFGLSGNFIGLTILSVGTSLVEIITHVVGSVRIVWQPDLMNTLSAMLIGSNIGSDIFQQNVVLAIVGLIGTVVVVRRNLTIEIGALVAASLLLLATCLGGMITRLEGLLLTLTYLAYLYVLWRREPNEHPALARKCIRPAALAATGIAVALCFVGMAMVADPLLAAATRLVARLPMSASLFGVVVLGVCTALPELMTALVSIAKGQREISAGILIGSNITNPLLSAGLGAMISGYTVPTVIVVYDLPVKIATGVLLYLFLWRRSDLSRLEAVTLVAVYFGYILARGVFFPQDFQGSS
jgi:cation:H+ antiporter